MKRRDWVTRLEQETGGKPLISRKKLEFLGYGNRRIAELVDGLDKYPGGKGKGSLYAVEDVATKIMDARC